MVEYTRDKILPEDLIQKTNLQQHNFMIDAINDIDGRQVAIEDVTNVNIDDIAVLKTNVVTLSNEKLDKDDINADLHFGDITVSREGTAVIMSLDVLNPTTGITTPISFTIPGATSAEAGVMDASSVSWISEADERISALEGLSDVKAVADLPGSPTQAQLTAGWVAVADKTPETGDILQDINNAKLWVFVGTDWVLYGTIVTVPLATTSTIGGVRDTSLTAPGNRWYVRVEADGRLTLIGGDSLSTLIDTTIPAIQSALDMTVKTTGNQEIAGVKTFTGGVFQKSNQDIGLAGYNARIISRLNDANGVLMFVDQISKESNKSTGRKASLANVDANGTHFTIARFEFVGEDKTYWEYLIAPNGTWVRYRTLNADSTGYSSTPYRPYAQATNNDILVKGHVADFLAPKQDVLSFDSAPISGSNNPVKSGGVYNALAAKADVSSLATKQDKLTFDSVPVSGSTKPVTSGGVYNALAGKADLATTPQKGDTITASDRVIIYNSITPNEWWQCRDSHVTNLVAASINTQNLKIEISDNGISPLFTYDNRDTANGDGATSQVFLVPKGWYYRGVFTASATCDVLEQPLTL